MNLRPVVIVTVIAGSGLCWALSAGTKLYRSWQGSERTSVSATPTSTPNKSPRAAHEHEPLMSEEQRHDLWEIEHRGNILVEYGFKALAKAIATNEPSAWGHFVSDPFVGRFPGAKPVVHLAGSHFEVSRLAGNESDYLVGPVAEFAAHWQEVVGQFPATPKGKISLMNLRPKNARKWDGSWEASCLARLWLAQDNGSRRELTAILDIEVREPSEEAYADGHWLERCSVRQIQTAESQRSLMTEVASEHGLAVHRLGDTWQPDNRAMEGGGAYLVDYNRDGCMDVLINQESLVMLYRGLGNGHFDDVTETTKLSSLHQGKLTIPAAFADLNGDGWEDLILGDEVYRNDKGHEFTRVTHICNLRMPDGACGLAIADYDNDGRVDIYVNVLGIGKTDSWLEGRSGRTTGNVLFRNERYWQFVDVTKHSGTEGGKRSTFSSVWFDADNDGYSDLYVINEFGNGGLFLNQKNGTFREQEIVDGPSDYGSMGVTCGDYDNDGFIDIYVAGMYSKAGNRVIGNVRGDTYSADVMTRLRNLTKGSQLHRNLGGGKFEQVGQSLQVHDVGWAYGPAMADFNNDGWLDVYATAGFKSTDRNKPDG